MMRVALVFAAVLGVAHPVARASDDPSAAAGGRVLAPHEMLQLRLEHNNLALYTPLPPTATEETLAVRVPAMRAAGEATITGGTGRAKPRPAGSPTTGPAGGGGARSASPTLASPEYFRLQLNSDDIPGQRVSWQIAWRAGGGFDVQRTAYFTGHLRYTRIVRLLAQPGERSQVGPDGKSAASHPVQLFVTESGNVGRERANVHVRADDFFSLVRSRPSETAEFLRPLMRELGQEAVFAPELPVAWQVFASHWSPPEQLRGDVTAVLPGLDSDKPADRDAASARLAELGREGALLLMKMDRSGLTPEQNSRIDAMVAAHAPLPRAEADRLRDDVTFLLDCLNSDDRPVRTAALEQLRTVSRRPLDFDVALDGPARGAAVAKLREGLGR